MSSGSRCSSQRRVGDRSDGAGFSSRPQPADVLLAEAAVGQPAEAPGQLRVVAELGMAVERQVIGDQVDVMLQQRLQARLRMPVTRPSSPRQNQP
jgi:hypothetical protein